VDSVATVHSEALPAKPGRELRCQLVVVEGPDMGRAAAVGAQAMVVGTDADCDLVLTDDRVSRRHLEARLAGGQLHTRDLDSSNGTLFEGSRIVEAQLPLGATLKLGRTFLRVQPEPEPLEVAPSQSRRFGEMVAESLVMREVFAVLELAARSDVTVLLEGETGTGKELAARALHEQGARRKGPFVAIDCGALPESLLESELFGHVRGAFTGASQGRAGAFARAGGGTLFLDELDAISPAVQARLLRVIEERKVKPVGSDSERELDVRIVGAARRDLRQRVTEGAFRPDLYYRLSVVRVALPPLRARREDLTPVVRELLARRGIEAGAVSGPNFDRLLAHGWPGNLRELRNVIDRGVALSPGAASFAELRLSVAPSAHDEPLAVRTDLEYADAKQLILDAFELRYLRDLLERTGGNLSEAARQSGVDRKHLRTLCRRHGLVAE
jgi:transcriptional regulator with PAS, ATPase and Fis domain